MALHPWVGFDWANISDPSLSAKLAGVGLLIALALRSIFNEIKGYISARYDERRQRRYRLLEASTAISDSEYHFTTFFDSECSRIVVVAQNLRTTMNTGPRPNLLDHLRKLIQINSRLTVEIILARPDVIEGVSEHTFNGLRLTIRDLLQFRDALTSQEASRVKISFHTSPISLSMFMRVRHHEGTIVISPKWALDTTPGGRVFIVIPENDAPELYKHFTGHIEYMTEPGSEKAKGALTLNQVAALALGVE